MYGLVYSTVHFMNGRDLRVRHTLPLIFFTQKLAHTYILSCLKYGISYAVVHGIMVLADHNTTTWFSQNCVEIKTTSDAPTKQVPWVYPGIFNRRGG